MNGTESPNSTPDNQAVVSESTPSKTAAFLFDEPNTELERSIAENGGGSGTDKGGVVENQEAELAKQAVAAQQVQDKPTEVKAEEIQTQVQPQNVVPIQPQAQPPVQQQAPQGPPQQQPQVLQQPPPAQQQPPQQQSPEEIQRALNVYSLSEQDYDSVFNVDSKEESIKALNDVLQKVVRQAVTMSHVLLQDQQQQILQQVQPYMQFADTQRQVMLESSFYQQHPDLQASKPVVDAVLKQFQSQGVKFSDEKQLFDAVAQNTKAYLSQLVQLGQTAAPTLQGQQQTQNGGTPQGAKPSMAALPRGGQGGAGASGGSGKVNTAQALFG